MQGSTNHSEALEALATQSQKMQQQQHQLQQLQRHQTATNNAQHRIIHPQVQPQRAFQQQQMEPMQSLQHQSEAPFGSEYYGTHSHPSAYASIDHEGANNWPPPHKEVQANRGGYPLTSMVAAVPYRVRSPVPCAIDE